MEEKKIIAGLKAEYHASYFWGIALAVVGFIMAVASRLFQDFRTMFTEAQILAIGCGLLAAGLVIVVLMHGKAAYLKAAHGEDVEEDED